MALVTRGLQFGDGNPAGRLAPLFNACNSSFRLFLTPVQLWYDPGYGTTMAGDYQCLPALDVTKELKQVRLGLRSLNFAPTN